MWQVCGHMWRTWRVAVIQRCSMQQTPSAGMMIRVTRRTDNRRSGLTEGRVRYVDLLCTCQQTCEPASSAHVRILISYLGFQVITVILLLYHHDCSTSCIYTVSAVAQSAVVVNGTRGGPLQECRPDWCGRLHRSLSG